MAVKGAASKAKVIETLLKTFPNSFVYNDGKEIRIPMMENGEEVEIKVALSCAKTAVRQATSTPAAWDVPPSPSNEKPVPVMEEAPPQISEEDRAKVRELMAKLGL